ncbi:hypothetical protein [Phreatobacter sp.]|uniref:hypothetical protein n=1 Tax=Phreatobacter sp. TaxID=1966341 RepID=UPI003F7263B4
MDSPTTSSDRAAESRAGLWNSLRERLLMTAVATVLLCCLAAAIEPEPRFMLAMLTLAAVLVAFTGLVALALRWLLIGRRR